MSSLVMANSCNVPTVKKTVLVMASLVMANSRETATGKVKVWSERDLLLACYGEFYSCNGDSRRHKNTRGRACRVMAIRYYDM